MVISCRNTDTKWSFFHRESFGEKLTEMEGEGAIKEAASTVGVRKGDKTNGISRV